MKAALSQGAVKPAGWFALAYLGYWVALGFDRILVEGVAYPLLGIRVAEWFVSAFRIRITHAFPDHFPVRLAVLFALPVLLELPFLILLARWGATLRSAFLRIVFHFAGLWIAVFLSSQGASLAYRGSLRMGQFTVPLSALGPNHLLKRFALTAAVALIVLGFGALCTRRLLADLRAALLPRAGWTGLALLLLIVPVLVILMAAFNFFSAIHFWGLRVIFYLLVPAAGCLLLALLGLSWKLAAVSLSGLSGRAGAVAVCVSVALYAGLQQAPRIEPWLIERQFQSFSSNHYQALYDSKAYQPETIRAFAAERERILAEEAVRLQEPLDPGTRSRESITLRVVLYPDLASLRVATGSDRVYSVDGTTIRAVLGDYIERVDPAADAAALLNAAWGSAGTAQMGEWVARWVAGEWRGRTMDYWVAQMEHEVGHYTLAQLADSSSDAFISPLVRQPLGAAWVGRVFDRWGLTAVRKFYAAKARGLDAKALAAQLGITPAQLEQDWRQWSAATASRTAADSPPPQRLLDANFFFRGISFSHEGWAGRGGGYISPEAAAQLRHLTALGANAIAVVPYGFAGGPHEEAISYTGTDETDEQLTHALHVAHSLGMKVMLKPQLWVTRGEFTGAIRFDDPAVRAAWMQNYREFILHYARLGELEQFDLLSIGTELEGLTPHADDWRRLIAEVRRVYHGPITYAANWGHEFESIGFWDALDYASVNNYYPLRSAPLGGAASFSSAQPKSSTPPRAEDLLPGAARLEDKLEALSRKWHKPVLFTEVGYPSVRGGASEPWIEDANRGVSLEEQAAAYEAIFRAFSGRAWFRGMFWWKWPSSGRGGGPRDASYTPLGKPAAEVLQGWFTRLAGASKSAATQSR